MIRTYYVVFGDGGEEIIVLPSITPNPHQYRIGVRIKDTTVWLRREAAQELAKLLTRKYE